MDADKAAEYVTDVSVEFSEKKQIEQYQPAEATVGYEAEDIPEDVDPVELHDALMEMAREQAKRDIMKRLEEKIKKDADIDE